MFDSHEEFNEWFSRDIESHAEKKSTLDENQLSRLHLILKPFMLRRIKKDVEHEMAEKVGGCRKPGDGCGRKGGIDGWVGSQLDINESTCITGV